MPLFRISYKDPETEAIVVIDEEFTDGGGISAQSLAEDRAYRKADKGWNRVQELVVDGTKIYPKHPIRSR